MGDKDTQAAEQLESTLGRLTVTFGHLEAELRLLLDCLLGGDGIDPAHDAPSVVSSSELPFGGPNKPPRHAYQPTLGGFRGM